MTLLVCRYSGTTPEAHFVARNTSMITRLTHEFNALRPIPYRRTWICPKDEGDVVDAVFVYRHLAPRSVWVQGEGCRFVTTGEAGRWAWYPPGPRLIDWLFTRVGCRPAPFRFFKCSTRTR